MELKPSTNPKARENFDNALVSMLSKLSLHSREYTFYAHMIAQCSVIFSEDLPAPAGVRFNHNSYELAINPDQFVGTQLELMAILKHEMLHIMLGHVHDKLNGRNQTKVNIAQDCSINQMIDLTKFDHKGWITPSNCPVKEGVALPLPPNRTYEEYYTFIEFDESPEQDHTFQNSSSGDPDMQKDMTKKMIDRSVESTQASGIGQLPSNIADILELFSRKSQVNWKQVLRNITGNKRTSSRRTLMRNDRRMPFRDDLRGKTKNRTFNLLVVGDESGSMCDLALTEGLGEVVHICNVTGSDLDYVAVDTRAYPPVKISKSQRSFSRSARGGTDLHPALKMAKNHNIDFQAVVVITDGWLCTSDVKQFEDLNKKVIWLIESGGKIMDEMSNGKMQAFKLDKVSKEN